MMPTTPDPSIERTSSKNGPGQYAVDILELVRGDEVHHLSDDRPANVPRLSPLAKMREYGPRRVGRSNR
jgi:hypothetical protein